MKYRILFFLLVSTLNRLAAQGSCNCCSAGGAACALPPGEQGGTVAADSRWQIDLRYLYLSLQPQARLLVSPEDNIVQPELLQALTAGVSFRLNKRIAFSAMMPFFAINAGGGRSYSLGDANGLVYLQKQNQTYGLRGGIGIKLPTGSLTAAGDQSVIIGTGSIDGLVAAQAWYKRGRIYCRYSGMFRYAGTGFNNMNFGHTLVNQAGVIIAAGQPRDTLKTRTQSVAFTADITSEWQQMQWSGITRNENSGQQNIWLGTGVLLQYRAFTVPLAAEVPVYHDHNGWQASPQFRLRAGLSVKFN